VRSTGSFIDGKFTSGSTRRRQKRKGYQQFRIEIAGEAAKGQRLKFRRFRARNSLFPLLLSSINLSESCRSSQAPRTPLQRRVRSRLSPPAESRVRTCFLDDVSEGFAQLIELIELVGGMGPVCSIPVGGLLAPSVRARPAIYRLAPVATHTSPAATVLWGDPERGWHQRHEPPHHSPIPPSSGNRDPTAQSDNRRPSARSVTARVRGSPPAPPRRRPPRPAGP